jgi:hypothetical protein
MPRRRSRRTHTASDLKQVAWSQKVLILCLIGYLFLWLGYIAFNLMHLGDVANDSTTVFNIVLVLNVVLGVVSGVFICLVEMKLSGVVVGVVVGLLTVVPCVGLLLVLIVNTRATSALQSNRVRVGLLGARMSDLATLSEGIDDEVDEDDDDYDDRPRRRGRSEYDVDEREGW